MQTLIDQLIKLEQKDNIIPQTEGERVKIKKVVISDLQIHDRIHHHLVHLQVRPDLQVCQADPEEDHQEGHIQDHPDHQDVN